MDCGNTWALGARGKSRNKAREGSRDDGPVGGTVVGSSSCLFGGVSGWLVGCLVGWLGPVGWADGMGIKGGVQRRVLGRTGLAGWTDGSEAWMGGKARPTFCWSISFGIGVSTGNCWFSFSLSSCHSLAESIYPVETSHFLRFSLGRGETFVVPRLQLCGLLHVQPATLVVDSRRCSGKSQVWEAPLHLRHQVPPLQSDIHAMQDEFVNSDTFPREIKA